MKKILLLFFALTSFALAQHSVTLSCTPATSGGTATGFNFKRATVSGGPYTTVGSPPTCAFVDSSITVQTEGAHFFYVVTAFNPTSESLPSAEVSATIPFSKPLPPVLAIPLVK